MVWYSTFDVWPQSSLRSASLTLFLKNIKTFNIWNIVEIIEFWALSFHRSQIFHPRWEGIIPHALNIVRTYMYVIFLTSRDILQCITSQLLMSFLLTILTSFILLLQVIFLLHFHLVCALSVQGGEKETCQLLCITASLHQYVLSLACQSFSFLSQVTSSDEFTINEAGNQKLIQDLVWVEEPQWRLPKAPLQKIFFAKSPSRLCPSRRQALLYRLGPGSYQGSLDPRS